MFILQIAVRLEMDHTIDTSTAAAGVVVAVLLLDVEELVLVFALVGRDADGSNDAASSSAPDVSVYSSSITAMIVAVVVAVVGSFCRFLRCFLFPSSPFMGRGKNSGSRVEGIKNANQNGSWNPNTCCKFLLQPRSYGLRYF